MPDVCIQRPYIVGDLGHKGTPATDVAVLEITWIADSEWRLRTYETTRHNIVTNDGLSRSPRRGEGIYETLSMVVDGFVLLRNQLHDEGYLFWRSCPHSVGPDTWTWPPNFRLRGFIRSELEDEISYLVSLESRSEAEIGNTTLRTDLSQSMDNLGVQFVDTSEAASRFRQAVENWQAPEPNPEPTPEQVDAAMRRTEEVNRIRRNQWMYSGPPIFPTPPDHEPHELRWTDIWVDEMTEHFAASVRDGMEELEEPPPEHQEPDEPPEEPPDVWDMLEV